MPVLNSTAVPARTRIPVAPPLPNVAANKPALDDDPTKEVNLAVVGGDQPQQFAANAGGVAAGKTDALLAMRAGKTPLAATLKQILADGERMKSDRAQLAGEEASEKRELDGMQLGVRERWLGSWAGVLGGDGKQGAHGGDLKADIASHDEKIAKLDADIAAIPQRLHDATAKQLLADGDSTFIALDQRSKAAHVALDLVKSFASDIADAQSTVDCARIAESCEQVGAAFQQQGNGPSLTEANARMNVSLAQSSLARVKDRLPEVSKQLVEWGHDAQIGQVSTSDMGNLWGWMADFSGSNMGVELAGALVSFKLSSASSQLDTLSSKVHAAQSAIAKSADAIDGERAKYLDDAQARALD